MTKWDFENCWRCLYDWFERVFVQAINKYLLNWLYYVLFLIIGEKIIIFIIPFNVIDLKGKILLSNLVIFTVGEGSGTWIVFL